MKLPIPERYLTVRQEAKRCRAFTLVEMLVTIGLVALLMLAVTQVFSVASKTIGGGQALGAAVRDAQAAQPVFAMDFGSVADDGAFFIIRSSVKEAYRNPSDELADLKLSTNPDVLAKAREDKLTFDFDGDGVEETILPAQYNLRNHRQDILVFFARNLVRRQTGNDGILTANQSSGEAMIWYGHLHLPNSATPAIFTDQTLPGRGTGGPTGTNPNNFYASQWTLGRVAMLLVDPESKTEPGGLNGTMPGGHHFYRRTTNDTLQPLSYSTLSDDSYPVFSSRYDLAGTKISEFSRILREYIAGHPVNPSIDATHWWNAFMTDRTPSGTIVGQQPGSAGGYGTFVANPYQTRPFSSASAAQQVPIFIPACTQFIVEFAGDFVSQNNDATDTSPNPVATPTDPAGVYGDVISSTPDGVVDWIKGTNQIRWYGMPRDTNGNGRITAADGDVVPVRDVVGAQQSFEQSPLPTTSVPTASNGYLDSSYAGTTLNDYVAAWGPDDTSRPKMVRITIVIDRPESEGKLFDGQSFEYVFNVGY